VLDNGFDDPVRLRYSAFEVICEVAEADAFGDRGSEQVIGLGLEHAFIAAADDTVAHLRAGWSEVGSRFLWGQFLWRKVEQSHS